MFALDGTRIASRCAGRREYRRLVGGTVETAAALRAVAVFSSNWGRANGTHGHGKAHPSKASTKKPAALGVIIVSSSKFLAASK